MYPGAISSAGGTLTGAAAAAQDSAGNTYVTALDPSGSAWFNIYRPALNNWDGWAFAGGLYAGAPCLCTLTTPTGYSPRF
jgi:hypothetical protein